jgi:hypothetical protein
MTPTLLVLLLLALGLGLWMARWAAHHRRRVEAREARAFEALFAARNAADGGASVDLDRIFSGVAQAAPAGAQAPPAGAGFGDPPQRPPADRPAGDDRAADPDHADDAPREEPTPVRDLVQALYEARGFRCSPAAGSASPIEAVLTHRSDERRAYAFAPLAQPPSPAQLTSIFERGRAIGQKRLLIAVESPGPGIDAEQPQRGVRLVSRATIEAHLARLAPETAATIRAAAARLAGQRRCRG